MHWLVQFTIATISTAAVKPQQLMGYWRWLPMPIVFVAVGVSADGRLSSIEDPVATVTLAAPMLLATVIDDDANTSIVTGKPQRLRRCAITMQLVTAKLISGRAKLAVAVGSNKLGAVIDAVGFKARFGLVSSIATVVVGFVAGFDTKAILQSMSTLNLHSQPLQQQLYYPHHHHQHSSVILIMPSQSTTSPHLHYSIDSSLPMT